MNFNLQYAILFLFFFLLLDQSAFSADLPSGNGKHTEHEKEPKHLVLVGGEASHDTGAHEHRAGVLLFERCLANVDALEVSTHFDGWPSDDGAFDHADAVLLYMDGGDNHPVVQGDRLELMQQHIDKGMGFGAMHYGVEVPAENGGDELTDWIGGHYETHYSANPIWEASFDNLPNHPILRGVGPFSVSDEWYFNIRFRPEMTGITPLLVTAPSDETRDGPYVHPEGPYDHIVDAKGESEVMSWVVDRKDGGRGFGFTGGHFHENWGNGDYRKYVLNSLVWLTGLDVPTKGVTCEVSEGDLEENLDR
ncbi:MAG: ThuA domain-containing protein [Balneolales bacterium]